MNCKENKHLGPLKLVSHAPRFFCTNCKSYFSDTNYANSISNKNLQNEKYTNIDNFFKTEVENINKNNRKKCPEYVFLNK
tara:strand:+ start:540 stop:779 length:240 start_codon:yes stop_codon:yes gene_type:complete